MEVGLNELKKRVKVCKKCSLFKTRNKVVFGEGTINSKIMFVGEAPGNVNDEVGKPFVGYGGKVFDNILKKCNLNRKDVFVTNVLKCWPPGNRIPLKNEIVSCRGYLQEQIDIIDPEIIFTLGRVAFETIAKHKIKLKKEHGKIFFVNGRKICPIFHPNGLRYIEGGMKTICNDLINVLEN